MLFSRPDQRAYPNQISAAPIGMANSRSSGWGMIAAASVTTAAIASRAAANRGKTLARKVAIPSKRPPIVYSPPAIGANAKINLAFISAKDP